MAQNNYPGRFDLRITVYQAIKLLLFTVLLAVVVKLFVFDTVHCAGNQMEPTILKGDHLLVHKFSRNRLVRALIRPPLDKVVAFKSPFQEGTIGLLRIAAISGDTISIDSGRIQTGRPLEQTRRFSASLKEIVPEDFSPRDYFRWYRIPAKGDLLLFNRMSLRDFFFAFSIIVQEQHRQKVTIEPVLLLDDSICTGYRPVDFSLYSGTLDSVPDSLRYNWFFWDRMEEYLFQKHDTRKVSLYFSLLLDGVQLNEYRVQDDYYFLLADNRKSGFDSRYAGPVRSSLCIGTVGPVLWSFGFDDNGKRYFRFNRLGRFVR